jgi:hypothetical protein
VDWKARLYESLTGKSKIMGMKSLGKRSNVATSIMKSTNIWAFAGKTTKKRGR